MVTVIFTALVPATLFASDWDTLPTSSVSDTGSEPISSSTEDDSIPEDDASEDESGSDSQASESESSREEPPEDPGSEPLDPNEPVIIFLDHISVIREDSRSRASAQMTLRRYDGIRWNFNKTSTAVNEHPWYLVDIGGAVAYCIEPNNPESNNGIYTTISYDALSTDQRYAIGYAMLYGSKDTRDPLYHMATQVIIWEIVYGYLNLTTLQPTGSIIYNNTIGYNSYNQQAAVNYNQILTDIRNHKAVPSFMSSVEPGMQSHTLSGPDGAFEATFTNTNPNARLADFNFTDTANVSFEKNGETLTVRSTSGLTDYPFAAYKGATGFTDSLLYWGNGNNQVRATAGTLTPVPAYFRISTKVVETKLELLKLDAETNEPIAGVEFEISAGGTVAGTYMSDQNGKVIVSGLAPGAYTIKETKAAPGYVLDPTERTVELVAGATVTVTWLNQPERGLIKIFKTAAEDSTLTGTQKGGPLGGAVFDIIDANGDVVDTLTTGDDGTATSKPLPLGVYTVVETSAPTYWFLNETEFTVKLEEHGIVVPLEVANMPVRISTTVDKYGVTETKPGETIRYDFQDIANTSNVPLSDFYWRDNLPAEVRLSTIVTGTWNEQLTYRIIYRTNASDIYRVLAENLSSSQNYFVDCRAETLGLASGEYVTEFVFEFGTVKVDFREVSAPCVFVRVNDGLPAGTQFVNRTDVGGRYEDEWVYSKDSWVTVVRVEEQPKLPKTGA